MTWRVTELNELPEEERRQIEPALWSSAVSAYLKNPRLWDERYREDEIA